MLFPLIHAATLDQWHQGRIPGSITGPHTGDYLTDTRCTCTNTTGRVGVAYEWVYYNYHSNATFILYWLDNSGVFETWNHGWFCRYYAVSKPPKNPRSRKTDELCIWPSQRPDLLNMKWEDCFSFNRQMRSLGKWGGQGRKAYPKSFVNSEICPHMCEVTMWGEHGIKGATGKGKALVFDDVDDMCDGCR